MQNELWTFRDYQNGNCELHMVNTPKPEPDPPADQEQSPAPGAEQLPFEPLTRERRKQLLQELTDKLLIEAHQNPMAFADDASTQLNKLLDLAGKQDAGAVDVRQITLDRFAELSLEDKDAALVERAALVCSTRGQGRRTGAPWHRCCCLGHHEGHSCATGADSDAGGREGQSADLRTSFPLDPGFSGIIRPSFPGFSGISRPSCLTLRPNRSKAFGTRQADY